MADPCFPITSNFNECDGSAPNSNFDLELEVLVGTFSEIKTKTRNATTPLIYENLVMDSTEKMFTAYFRMKNPLDDMTETSEEKSFALTGKVEGEIVIYGRTPEAAYQKFVLDNNRIFMIAKQASQAGTSAHRIVIGGEAGLKPAPGENFTKDKGGYVFKFMADFLTYPQEYLWAGTEGATAAIEAALIIAGV